MQDTVVTWIGIDAGREGLLIADDWFTVLKILANHEGGSHRDVDSQLFTDLASQFPDISWLGSDGNRSFFRDYGKPWKDLGVLNTQLFNNTGEIQLSPLGRRLVAGNIELPDFFKKAIDDFRLASIKVTSNNERIPINPFWAISTALIQKKNYSASALQADVENICIDSYARLRTTSFSSSTHSGRKFRNYLHLLANAGTIELQGTQIVHVDLNHLVQLATGSNRGISQTIDHEEYTDLESMLNDTRRRRVVEQVQREGQREFRDTLLEAYQSTCAITGVEERSVLEAAHIMNYRGRQTNSVNNGILLAVDIHRLFDNDLLGINPDTFAVEISETLKESRYNPLQGLELRLPSSGRLRPDPEYLRDKYAKFKNHKTSGQTQTDL